MKDRVRDVRKGSPLRMGGDQRTQALDRRLQLVNAVLLR